MLYLRYPVVVIVANLKRKMMYKITKDELIKIAVKAGFGGYESSNCSGESDFDEQLCVGEYPCAENVLTFARLLGVEVTE